MAPKTFIIISFVGPRNTNDQLSKIIGDSQGWVMHIIEKGQFESLQKLGQRFETIFIIFDFGTEFIVKGVGESDEKLYHLKMIKGWRDRTSFVRISHKMFKGAP